MNKIISSLKGSVGLLALVSVFVFILIPMSPMLINLLLVFSMAWALILYMRSSSIKEWDELSTFPTMLLLSTIFRIVLNISTTRKILHDGNPGSLIEAAGNVVLGTNVVVGIVIFLILIIVQFVVANGSARTAEVAARFTLDSLPGKQMSIDSDLQQRLITEEEGRARRKKLDMEVDFFGNMEGAGKFIKGDVIIGIVLVLINITAGLIIGMVSRGMSFAEAGMHYTILTVGDGVINQLCSLLISIASGMVMLRVSDGSGKNITQSIVSELTNNPLVLYVTGVIFLSLGLFTEFPLLPFAVFAALLIWMGYRKAKQIAEMSSKEDLRLVMAEEELENKDTDKVEVITEIEPITLEVGIALVPVVGHDKEGDTIKDKITMIRKSIAKELGVKIPSIHVLDNSSLSPYTRYNILIKDAVAATGELRVNQLLALKTPYTIREIDGFPVKDPVFNEDALWINDDKMDEASEAGYTVLDPLSILSTHLNEIIRRNLHIFIQRQEVQNMLDGIENRQRVIIDEIKKKEIDLSIIQGVIQNLLRESVSIRDLPLILESILDCKTQGKVADFNKIDDITYLVREKLSKQICKNAENQDGKMYIILPSTELERAEVVEHHDGYYLNIDAITERDLFGAIKKEVEKAQIGDIEPVLLTKRPELRFALSRLIQKYSLQISVLSMNELVPGTRIEHIGTVKYTGRQTG